MSQEAVELKYLIERFEEVLDGIGEDDVTAYFDKRDRKVYSFEDRFLGLAEDGEDPNALAGWEREEARRAVDFLEHFDDESLVPLPGKYELREYDLMEEFGELQANPGAANQLLRAIQGKGAFRRFRDTLGRLGLTEEWYAYRARAMERFVRNWCEQNGVGYTPKRPAITYRRAADTDIDVVTGLLAKLYYKSKNKIREHHAELRAENQRLLASDNDALFVAFSADVPIGAAHVSLRREYVEGTAGGTVGYLEGLFVLPEHRLQGAGRGLLAECRKWALANACDAFASDCEIGNEAGYRFHLKTGFEEASRNVHFTMPLFMFGLDE